MDSWPPASTILLSPSRMAWAPSATVRRPEPHTMLMPQAGVAMGMPAAIEAWRAGFWPWAAVRTWPRMTSEISSPETLARASAALMATSPNLWAGRVAKAPLNAPTGVRAAETMTTSSMKRSFRKRTFVIAARKMPRTRAMVNCGENAGLFQWLNGKLTHCPVLRMLKWRWTARLRGGVLPLFNAFAGEGARDEFGDAKCQKIKPKATVRLS